MHKTVNTESQDTAHAFAEIDTFMQHYGYMRHSLDLFCLGLLT